MIRRAPIASIDAYRLLRRATSEADFLLPAFAAVGGGIGLGHQR